MAEIMYDQKSKVNTAPFDDLIGTDFVSFLFENAPHKITTRVAKALEHAEKAESLHGVDEEMGFIRLVAAEEELVVSIFEWLKLHPDLYPEHKDFVSKFKNHEVKLAFYPVLMQFRWILEEMLSEGLTFDGFEDVFSFQAKPVVDAKTIRLAMIGTDGRELWRHDPLHITISRDDLAQSAIVPALFEEFAVTIKEQRGQDLKAFVRERADFRNKLLYASDAGSVVMGDSFDDLLATFRQTYRDLLWVLLILIGGRPINREWGIVAQYFALYRQVLVAAGVIKDDGSVLLASE